MKKRMTDEQQYFYDIIDKILWEDWDPLGVNDVEEVRDEYEDCTNQIFSLKNRGANIDMITNMLYEIETITMGVFGNREHCRQVAEKIINITYQ